MLWIKKSQKGGRDKGSIGPRAMKSKAQTGHQKRHHPVEASLSKARKCPLKEERGDRVFSVGRISQMQTSQSCHKASASSTGAPQNAQRQRGFYPPKANAENPRRGP